jgi:hypothetical protein
MQGQVQYVSVPQKTWERIERILNRLDKEVKQPARAEWITARMFASRTKMTKEQMRGFRKKHTEMIKTVAVGYKGIDNDGVRTVRYLYDWTAYTKTYLTV